MSEYLDTGNMVIEVLTARFASVPKETKEAVKAVEKHELLKELLRDAIHGILH